MRALWIVGLAGVLALAMGPTLMAAKAGGGGHKAGAKAGGHNAQAAVQITDEQKTTLQPVNDNLQKAALAFKDKATEVLGVMSGPQYLVQTAMDIAGPAVPEGVVGGGKHGGRKAKGGQAVSTPPPRIEVSAEQKTALQQVTDNLKEPVLGFKTKAIEVLGSEQKGRQYLQQTITDIAGLTPVAGAGKAAKTPKAAKAPKAAKVGRGHKAKGGAAFTPVAGGQGGAQGF